MQPIAAPIAPPVTAAAVTATARPILPRVLKNPASAGGVAARKNIENIMLKTSNTDN
jgi:hypothetical protein